MTFVGDTDDNPRWEHPTKAPGGLDGEACNLHVYRPTYRSTLAASILGTLVFFVGLYLLGVGAKSQSTTTSILLRIVAWMVLFQIPVQAVAVMNLRSFCMYGVVPRPTLREMVTFNPICLREHARSIGIQPWRGVLMPILAHAVWIALSVAFISIPIGETHGFMGFVFIYGIGHALIIAFGNAIINAVCRPLDQSYGVESGPPSFGLSMLGFFFTVTGCALAQRHLGAWFGAVMPLALTVYEGVCTKAMGKFFVNRFVLQSERLSLLYKDSQQDILPSCMIALAVFMVQGARVTILLADLTVNPDSRAWMVNLCMTLFFGILTRTYWVDKTLNIVTKRFNNFARLKRQVMFQAVYPALFAVLAFPLARFALGHTALPHTVMGWFVLCLVGANILEDFIVFGLLSHGCAATWAPLPFDADATREHIVKTHQEGADEAMDNTQVEKAVHAHRLAHELTTNLDAAFTELPFWAHFTAVIVAQFHLVLVIIVFGGGINYTLGFCDQAGYVGTGRGAVWWPIMDLSNPCDGELW